jgi:hypothetical protein
MAGFLSTVVPSSPQWPVAYGGTTPICPGTGERHQSAITHVSALNARRLQGPLVLCPLARRAAAPAREKQEKVGQWASMQLHDANKRL